MTTQSSARLDAGARADETVLTNGRLRVCQRLMRDTASDIVIAVVGILDGDIEGHQRTCANAKLSSCGDVTVLLQHNIVTKDNARRSARRGRVEGNALESAAGPDQHVGAHLDVLRRPEQRGLDDRAAAQRTQARAVPEARHPA